jgi:hypothetical protein
MWEQFEMIPPKTLNVFLTGTSRIHANLNPVVFFMQDQLFAFDGSGSDMDLKTTRFYIQQMYKSQNPGLVVIDGAKLGMSDNTLSRIQQQNISIMPFGIPKLQAISASIEPADWGSIIHPVLFHHGRWPKVKRADFSPKKYDSAAMKNVFLGYRASTQQAKGKLPTESLRFDADAYRRNYRLLDDIVDLCRERNSQVLILLAPCREGSYESLSARLKTDLKRDYPISTVRFLDANTREVFSAAGIDLQQDFSDNRHMNYKGAEKFSRWFGNFLMNTYKGIQAERESIAAQRYFQDESARYLFWKQKASKQIP